MPIGPGTTDSCTGQEAPSSLTTVNSLSSPTTSRLEANTVKANQGSEDSLAQVEKIIDKYELESGQSLGVKGNLKKKLTFWRTIGCPTFYFDHH